MQSCPILSDESHTCLLFSGIARWPFFSEQLFLTGSRFTLSSESLLTIVFIILSSSSSLSLSLSLSSPVDPLDRVEVHTLIRHVPAQPGRRVRGHGGRGARGLEARLTVILIIIFINLNIYIHLIVSSPSCVAAGQDPRNGVSILIEFRRKHDSFLLFSAKNAQFQFSAKYLPLSCGRPA